MTDLFDNVPPKEPPPPCPDCSEFPLTYEVKLNDPVVVWRCRNGHAFTSEPG